MKYAFILSDSTGPALDDFANNVVVLGLSSTADLTPAMAALETSLGNNTASAELFSGQVPAHIGYVRIEGSVAVGDVLDKSQDVWHKRVITP